MRKKTKLWNYFNAYYILYKNPLEITDEESEEKNEICLTCARLSPEIEVLRKDSFKKLSDEAKEVIYFVLGDDTLEARARKNGKIKINLLRKIFKKKWRSKFIRDVVFREIKIWVKTF